MDVRISLNHDTLEYEADYIEHGKLCTICACPRYRDALKMAKRYVEDTAKQLTTITTLLSLLSRTEALEETIR